MVTKKVKKEEHKPDTIIQNCNFTGVQWDQSAISSMDKILDGVIEITKSNIISAEILKVVAEQFKKLDVKFDALLSVNKESVLIANCVFTNNPQGSGLKCSNNKFQSNG